MNSEIPWEREGMGEIGTHFPLQVIKAGSIAFSEVIELAAVLALSHCWGGR